MSLEQVLCDLVVSSHISLEKRDRLLTLQIQWDRWCQAVASGQEDQVRILGHALENAKIDTQIEYLLQRELGRVGRVGRVTGRV